MKYTNMAVQESDLIIALGIRFDDRITGTLNTFAPKAKIIHCDIDKSENGKNVPTALFLHGDVKEVITKLPDTTTKANRIHRENWFQYLKEQKAKYPLGMPTDTVFSQVLAIKTLSDMLAEDAVIATDVGQHQMWAAQYMLKMKPNHFLTSGGLGSMGFGLPAAMGAQAGALQKNVWCITGDGSFQMNFQELMTCVQENWPVKILVLDNAYLGMVRQWQEQFYKGNYSGVELQNPDFVMLANSFGIEAMRVDNAEELKVAIAKANSTPKPYLIHARVEKEESVLPMVAPGTGLSDTIYYPTKPTTKP
jgi:acetolactate synthase-1/2/3 large subunit